MIAYAGFVSLPRQRAVACGDGTDRSVDSQSLSTIINNSLQGTELEYCKFVERIAIIRGLVRV